VRRHCKSLVEVTGARWNSGKEVVRDIGIALAFWVVALMALRLTASLLRFQGSQPTLRALAPESPAQTITLDSLVHYRELLRGDDFPRLPAEAVHRLDRQLSRGRIAFRGDLWRTPHLPGSGSRGSDSGVWGVVRSISAAAKELASRNDHARAA
jgi:hypothetical protein